MNPTGLYTKVQYVQGRIYPSHTTETADQTQMIAPSSGRSCTYKTTTSKFFRDFMAESSERHLHEFE